KAAIKVFHQAVDAAIGYQAKQMQRAAIVQGKIAGGIQLGILEELALDDLARDAPGVLVDDSAGANVLVADFAVAHGALGQADVKAAGLDEHAGVLAH